MFYTVPLSRQVDVEPRMFGPNLQSSIKAKVEREAQGTVDARVGSIIHVRSVELIGKLLPHASARGSVQGLIRSDGSGLATFNVSYDCVCMRLWPNEVVDAVVEQVTSYGIRCKVGPFRIFVSEKNMPDEFVLRNVANQDVWVSEAEGLEVREGIFVRIRIANIQLQPEKLGGVATMKGDYLGPIS